MCLALPSDAQPTAVAVYESAMASRWLTGASIAHLSITAESLESETLPRGGVLVVPLDRVRTGVQARRIAEFAAGGGRLLAVYWGPLVRPEFQSAHPVYALGPLLGVRPTGWRGADPLVVRPGESDAGSLEIENVRLARGPLVRVEPSAGARVVARWARPMKREGPEEGPGEGPLAVAFGPHLYLATDLFAPQNDTPEARQIFLWAIDQLAPGFVYSRARERAGAAMAAVIRAQTALTEARKARPMEEFRVEREKLAEARDLATRAKQAAATDRFFEAISLAVRAHALAEEVLRLLTSPPAPPSGNDAERDHPPEDRAPEGRGEEPPLPSER